MKRLRTAAGAALVATGLALGLTLTGCGVTPASGSDTSTPTQTGRITGVLSAQHVTLADGRTVTCVILSAPNAGGLSCDWVNAE